MNNVDKIRELTRGIERGCDKMSDGLCLAEARKMLVLSECITSSLQAYLFTFLVGSREEI